MDTCTSGAQRKGDRAIGHMTTSDVGRLRRKSAAASDRPGSEWEQPSKKVVSVKFGGSKGEWMGIHKRQVLSGSTRLPVGGGNDSRSNSGTGVEVKTTRDYSAGASVIHF